MTKEEIYGLTGSGIICLLIALFLFVTVLQTSVKAGEEGILVNFGNVDLSTGNFEPRRGEPRGEADNPVPTPPQQNPPVQQNVPAQQNVPSQERITPNVQRRPQNNAAAPALTQNLENTAAIETARKEQEERNRIEAEQRAQQAKEQEEQRRRDAINQQISGAFGTSDNGPNQRGTGTTGTGIQGNPNSTTSAGSPTGTGTGQSGTGYGEFNLGGRTLGRSGLPRPDYSAQEEGRIVINITVNPSGIVIFAEIGRGTNIDNINLRNSALEAARNAKFNSINGNNNQSGTITYHYRLR
jgi:TonB family protein